MFRGKKRGTLILHYPRVVNDSIEIIDFIWTQMHLFCILVSRKPYSFIDSLRVTFVLLLLSILSMRQKICCHVYIRDENEINSVTAQMDIRILLLTENICNERTTKVTWWVSEWVTAIFSRRFYYQLEN
jgi:hypothetical protein